MQNPKFERFKKYFNRHKPSIQEIVREPTAGGVVFRRNKAGEVEILLIQDAKDRWTILRVTSKKARRLSKLHVVKLAKKLGFMMLKC